MIQNTPFTQLQVKLAQRLLNGKTYSAQFLANSLGISSKTVRKNLAELGTILKDYNIEIISTVGVGYCMAPKSEKDLKKLTSILNAATEQESEHVSENRIDQLIRFLLAQNSGVTLDDMGELLFMNRTSVKKYLKQSADFLHNFALSIKSTRKRGFFISGKEHDLRCLIEFEEEKALHTGGCEGELFYQLYVPSYHVLEKLTNIIIEAQDKYSNYHFSEESIETIARLLFICSIRGRLYPVQEYDEYTERLFTARNTFLVARIIAKQAEKVLNYSFTIEDEILLCIYLVTFRVNINTNDVIRPSFMGYRNYAFELTEYLAMVNHFQFINRDIKLIDQLVLRMEMIDTGSKYHIRTMRFENFRLPLMGRKLGIQAAGFLHRKYGFEINEEVISILGLVLFPYTQYVSNPVRKINVCCISSIDLNTGYTMAAQIKSLFPDKTNKTDVLNTYEMDKLNSSNYDVLFTDLGLNKLSNVNPVIQVFSYDINHKEACKVEFVKWMMHDFGNMNMTPYFSKERFFTKLSCHNVKECIAKIADLMSAYLDDRQSFIEDLQYCEQVFPYKAHNNVVILSGEYPHTEEPSFSIFVLNHSIALNNQNERAQVIVYWDSGKDINNTSIFENDYATNNLFHVFSDSQMINELIKQKKFESIMNALKEHGDIITLLDY